MSFQAPIIDPASLPYRPYCADDFTFGVKIRGRDQSITFPNIQLNPPGVRWALTVDMDRPEDELADPWKKPGPAWDWESAGLPAPSWVAINRDTASCHYGYRLTYPVCVSDCAQPKPLRFLADVERSLVWTLRPYGADANYTGLMTKNPLHPRWRLWSTGQMYSLGDLMEWIDERPARDQAKDREFGLGRNCDLFDELRFWAYQEVRHYRGEERYTWNAAVQRRAKKLNNFQIPLDQREVAYVGKSVARWTWKTDPKVLQVFIARQAWKGKGGKNPEQARERKKANWRAGRPTIGKPWKDMGISRRTYYRRKAAGQLPRTDGNTLLKLIEPEKVATASCGTK
jgi:hypothetical protein